MIVVYIYNNGLVCGMIVKLNGLKGIEKRVVVFGGEVVFFFGNEMGFDVKIRILCKEEWLSECYDCRWLVYCKRGVENDFEFLWRNWSIRRSFLWWRSF